MMPRRVICAHPGCDAKVDAARKTGLCVTHYVASIRAIDAIRPAPRWPIRTVIVPQFGVDGYRYRAVSLPREPWIAEGTP